LRVRIPDVQVFNEILVQYFHKGKLRRIVSNNVVLRAGRDPVTRSSFNLKLEEAKPLFILEYVSPHSMRRDYNQRFVRYEKELRVPYCLIFYPEMRDLRVWRHGGRKYERIIPDGLGRHPIPDLELEVALEGDW
jgi:Uma2 family endonuclease